MHRILLKSIAVLGLAFMTSCSSDDNTATQDPAYIRLQGDAPSQIDANGGSVTVKLNATEKPSCEISDSWLTVESSSSVLKEHSFVLTAANNDTEGERATTVKFSCPGFEAVSVNISQAAPKKADTVVVPSFSYEKVEEVNAAMEVAYNLGLGWNLGNQFDAHNNGVASETAWGNPKTTQALFTKVKSAGFTAVRIPVTWMGHIGDAPDYKIEDSYLDRIYEVVGFAEKAGLNAIVNIHHDGADSKYWLDIKKAATDAATHEQIKNELTALWTQIAEKFKDKGDFLIFEPFNEIHDGGWGWGDNRNDGGKQYQCVNEWNQTFVDAVRATGGKNETRYLAAVGYCANPDMTMENLVLPTDPTADRLIVAVHFYDPYEFTLNCSKSEWGWSGDPAKKASYGDEDGMVWVFNNLYKKYVKNGIPVYIGESGSVRQPTERSELFRKYYMEFLAKCARYYGLSLFVWDNGSSQSGAECSGLFNHGTGDYYGNSEEIIGLLTKGYYNDDPDYTIDHIFANSAPAKE